MSLISLRHLYTFGSVAETGGIRRSAEALYRASSAVARAVAALEQQLQVPLFERKGSGMLLTTAGEAVRVRALRIEAELRLVRDEALRQSKRSGGMDALRSSPRLQVATLLAEVHHMPTVARATGMSQPAVSQAIARLEDALGQPLFMRSARGMVPTFAGERWVVHFERVLAELRHIEADIAALKGVLQGVVTIGALPLARTLLLPAAIAQLNARHPNLRVRSLESPYEELCAGLRSGKIDFIVGALRPADGTGLATIPLFKDPTVLLAGAGHPLAGRAELSLRDLDGYPWVLSRAGTPVREALEQFFAERNHPAPRPVVETGDLALLRGLLVQGGMLTVLSAQQLHYEIQAGTLVVLPMSMPGMARQIGITMREGAHLAPGARALLEEIERVGSAWSRS